MTRTWMLGDVHWLRDSNMLPKAIPYARISVFGYRSQWVGGDAVENDLPQIAKDLLRVIKHDRRKSASSLESFQKANSYNEYLITGK